MLCGISVLFRTLSPSDRQVTHALLTRPPLRLSSTPTTRYLLCLSLKISLIKNAPHFWCAYFNSIKCSVLNLISVRLACVRHAASVRPEPGSNSLKIVFNRSRGAFKSFRVFEKLYLDTLTCIPVCWVWILNSSESSVHILPDVPVSLKVITGPSFRNVV